VINFETLSSQNLKHYFLILNIGIRNKHMLLHQMPQETHWCGNSQKIFVSSTWRYSWCQACASEGFNRWFKAIERIAE